MSDVGKVVEILKDIEKQEATITVEGYGESIAVYFEEGTNIELIYKVAKIITGLMGYSELPLVYKSTNNKIVVVWPGEGGE